MTVLTFMLLACTSAKPGAGVDSGVAASTVSSADDTGSAVTTDADGDGFTASPDGTDCDDNDASVYPGAEETCGDGVDQDCDGAELGCTGRLMSTMGGGWLQGGDLTYGVGRSATALHGWREDGGVELALGAPWWSTDEASNVGAVFLVQPEMFGVARSIDDYNDGFVFEDGVGIVLGWSVDGGDVDGDGIDDLLIGGPGGGSDLSIPGRLRLVYGPFTGELSALDASVDWISDTQDYRGLGGAVVISPDVTGDGQPDLVAGWSGGCRDDGQGGVYIIDTSTTLNREVGVGDVELSGEAPCLGFLGMVATGDLNGDGVDDVAVGAYAAGKPGDSKDDYGPGRMYIVDGPVTASMNLADADGGLVGAQDESLFGHGVAIVPDLDADGLSDLLAGAQWEDGGYYRNGAAYVVKGGSFRSWDAVDDVAMAIIEGAEDGMELGNVVADGGDQDGDGQREVLVAAASSKNNGYRGQVFVFHGPVSGSMTTDDAILEVFGRSDKDDLGAGFNGWGSALMGGVDLNQDGSDDWVVGANLSGKYYGAVYAFYGGLWP